MTKDELAKIVEGMPQGMDIDDYLLELVNRALFLERDACAQLCEDHFSSDGEWCAKQIRARGQK